MIEVLHTEAARIFNKALDFFVSLYPLITAVVDVHHIRHKTIREKTERCHLYKGTYVFLLGGIGPSHLSTQYIHT